MSTHPPPELKQCTTCGANIFFAWTEKGKKIPIDWAVHPEGNLVTLWRRGTPVALAYSPEKHKGWFRRKTHFATCPQADEHRKRAKGGKAA